MNIMGSAANADIFESREVRSSWQLNTQATVSYEVVLAEGLLEPENLMLVYCGVKDSIRPNRRLVVIDANVDELFGERVRAYFARHGVQAYVLPMEVSEEVKDMERVCEIARVMSEFGLSRRSEPVIAMGGGVLLDIVGVACNLFRRGVPYVRIPTTLMGQIDAGIGAKTGVNFDQHKNRLGTYYAPRAAYIDRSFLRTLDHRHMANGVAEIIKIALVKDRELFELLEAQADRLIAERMQGRKVYEVILDRAITGMLEELEPNLWENQLERLVDFGHSWGPSIEMKALPELLHGESVAIDMAYSVILSALRGLMNVKERDRALSLISRFGLPIHHPLCTAGFMEQALADTTRHRDGLQRLPLTRGIGEAAFVNDLSYKEMEKASRLLATHSSRYTERKMIWRSGVSRNHVFATIEGGTACHQVLNQL